MMLLYIFIPVGSTQIHHSCGIIFVYKLVKRSFVPQVKPGIDSRANIFGATYKAGAFQNIHLKNDHPLGISLPTSYAVKLQRKC